MLTSARCTQGMSTKSRLFVGTPRQEVHLVLRLPRSARNSWQTVKALSPTWAKFGSLWSLQAQQKELQAQQQFLPLHQLMVVLLRQVLHLKLWFNKTHQQRR